MNFRHSPVLLNETIQYLKPERGGIFVDGTIGGGGHSEAILSLLPSGGFLYGIDRDQDALEASENRLSRFGDTLHLIHGNFFDMKRLLTDVNVSSVNGILLDLGVSSFQLDNLDRGFSYQHDAPLDMRMDRTSGMTARDVVNRYSFEQLCRIFRDYGEERYADRIADRIIRARAAKPIETTGELSSMICAAMPKSSRREAQHPAKRCFQAIRIEVNGELNGLENAVKDAHDLLASGGRLVTITFHSLEDRIIKRCFKMFENPCTCPPKAPVCVCGRKPTARILTNKPVTCSLQEQLVNPRASCAKLRAIEKL